MGFVSYFDRILGAVIVACNCVASAWIFVMMLAVVADIVGRFVFNAPIAGVTELVTMSIVMLLYLQLSFTLRSGTMTRSDAVLGRLITHRPVIGRGLAILFSCAGAALMGAIMIGAWPKWIKAYDLDFYVGVVGVFTFPDWPRLLIVFIGCGLTALQFLAYAAMHARALCHPVVPE